MAGIIPRYQQWRPAVLHLEKRALYEFATLLFTSRRFIRSMASSGCSPVCILCCNCVRIALLHVSVLCNWTQML